MSKTHKILMVACCLIGLGAAAAILLFGVSTNTVLLGLMVLLCPLSHLLMMRFMGHNHADHSSAQHHIETAKDLKGNASNS